MTYRNVVVAVNGSAASQRALEQALVLVDRRDGQLTVVGVEHARPTVRPDRHDGHVRRALAAAVDRARAAGVSTAGKVLDGYPAAAIVAFADEHQCDLIVLGAGGHGGHGLGATADKVVDLAPCGVLVSR